MTRDPRDYLADVVRYAGLAAELVVGTSAEDLPGDAKTKLAALAGEGIRVVSSRAAALSHQ